MAKTDFEREETRQFRELRKEIIKLRHENAQLKKRNRQLEQQLYYNSSEDEDDLEMIKESLSNNHSKAEKDSCPACGAYEILYFQLMDRTYYRCNSCNSKGKCKE